VNWIFLSPHFDDIALSCGGLIWELTNTGNEVQVWTICAGKAPVENLSPFAQSLHDRWDTREEGPEQRRLEDITSNQILGSNYLHFSIPDCIYRQRDGQYLYDSEEDLFGSLHNNESDLVDTLALDLEKAAEGQSGPTTAVCPIGFGGHVDHRLTHLAAEKWQKRRPEVDIWYYADFPYSLQEEGLQAKLENEGWKGRLFPISEEGIEVWIAAVAAHQSQISTFWPDMEAMRRSIIDYLDGMGGVWLWKPKNRVKNRCI
jgi:LmbE family N-acetylglucosaminyl deacetylase